MKKITLLLLFTTVLVACLPNEPEPTVGKVLGVKQMLGNDEMYEIGIMVHVNFIPYCTKDSTLATNAETMLGEWVVVDWMLEEDLACPIILSISLHDSKILENKE